MNLRTLPSVVALAMNLSSGAAMAASPAIGTVIAKGVFRLDNSTINGNATLFEGSTLETSLASSSVQLSSGARFLLGPGSRGRLFGDHTVLEKGRLDLENAAGMKLVALGMTIQPDRGTLSGLVFVDHSRVRIAVAAGSLRVFNASGQVVANMAPGTAMAFDPQPTTNITRVTGVLEKKGDHYILTDEITKVTVEVKGADLAKYAGKRIEVNGVMDAALTPVSDASQVVIAKEIRVSGKPLAAAAAKGGAAAGAAGGAAGAAGAGGATIGGIAISTVAIVGGVAAAATVGGLAAADALPGQGSSASVSR
ncbi:MAG: hypothetical protein WDO18_01470 [Acidobacteriota bacterium]